MFYHEFFSIPEQMKINARESRPIYYFTFSDKMSNMKIEKAVLYMHIRTMNAHVPHDKKFVNFTIRIMEVIPQKKGESPVTINYGWVHDKSKRKIMSAENVNAEVY